jgi:hypothetical protein
MTVKVRPRSNAAKRIRRELDRMLADTATRTGQSLQWDQADDKLLAMLQDHVDREVMLTKLLDTADSVRQRIELATELRLTQGAITRLLKEIRASMPAEHPPMSATSLKAQRAAQSRWHRERLRQQAGG